MSDITPADLRAVLSLSIQVARVDKQMAVYEKEIIDQMAEALGLSPDEKAAELDAQLTVGETFQTLSGEPAKQFMVKSLCAVAFADGRDHEGERAIIDDANGRLNPPLELKPWEQWEDYVEEVVDALLNFKA